MFQEQLITGERSDEKQCGVDTSSNDLGLMESTLDAMVDLQQSAIFEEPFYIVVLERTQQGTTVHMWRLVIASQPETTGTCYTFIEKIYYNSVLFTMYLFLQDYQDQ